MKNQIHECMDLNLTKHFSSFVPKRKQSKSLYIKTSHKQQKFWHISEIYHREDRAHWPFMPLDTKILYAGMRMGC